MHSMKTVSETCRYCAQPATKVKQNVDNQQIGCLRPSTLQSSAYKWDTLFESPLKARIEPLPNTLCGVTYRLLAGRHRPDEAVEGAMWGWPQIEVCPDCLDYSWVRLRQPLDRCLECEASGNVLPQKGDNFSFFLAQILRVCASSGHDSRKESAKPQGVT